MCLRFLMMLSLSTFFTAPCTMCTARCCYRNSSVRPSVPLMYRGHISWVSSKVIIRLLMVFASLSHNIDNLVQGEHSQKFGWNRGGSLFSAENLQYLWNGEREEKSYYCVPRTQTSFGDRWFTVAGPRTCNNLPDAIRDSSLSFMIFTKLLKSLFDCRGACDF